MNNAERLKAKILAAEISGVAYSFEKLIIIEPTPYTEHIQDDKLIEYSSEMVDKMEQLNDIIAKHFDGKAK